MQKPYKMKKSQLRQIIKEEIRSVLNEGEILSSSDVEVAVVKTKGKDEYNIAAVDKKDDSIEAIDRRKLSQKDICKMDKEQIDKRFNILTRDLFENKINEDFGAELEIVGRGDKMLNFCPIK